MLVMAKMGEFLLEFCFVSDCVFTPSLTNRYILKTLAGRQVNMSQVNTEITKSMSEEQRMIRSLLANARECLLADPSVQNLLGDAISLGKPFSKVASSTMVNDITRSRLQLGIPIEGSFGSGRIRLVANQDEIEILELDVEGRVIDVRLDKDRRSDGFVDVDVVNREMY